MQATIDGYAIDLPKLTLELSDEMDAVQAAQPGRAKFAAQYDFLKHVIEPEALAEMLDGDELETIDLAGLQLIYINVLSAYKQPMLQAQMEQLSKVSASVAPLMETMKAAQQMASRNGRQGFRRVK